MNKTPVRESGSDAIVSVPDVLDTGQSLTSLLSDSDILICFFIRFIVHICIIHIIEKISHGQNSLASRFSSHSVLTVMPHSGYYVFA